MPTLHYTAHQLHLPHDLRLFHYCAAPIAHTQDAIVFEGRYDGTSTVICRSYLFFKRWLEIFVTFDEDYALRPDPHFPFPFAFNCDITTPYYCAGSKLYTTDLCLDVLVAADGRSYQIQDQDEFEHMHQQGMFGSAWANAALAECESLLKLLDAGHFLAMLTNIAPFPSALPATPLSTMQCVNLDAGNFIEHPDFPKFGAQIKE